MAYVWEEKLFVVTCVFVTHEQWSFVGRIVCTDARIGARDLMTNGTWMDMIN